MLLRTEKLTKTFRGKKYSTAADAVKEADIFLNRGETVGLLGESGSGKSTLGLMVAGLVKPTAGMIFYQGKSISYPYRGKLRCKIQILFQHPEVSFNPALPLIRSMEEPYKVHNLPYSRKILQKDIEKFGLRMEHMERYPSELSGGELQRAALARVLTMSPEVIVLDEPTSMLDVITQAQMIQMLRAIQEEHKTSYLFISHDPILSEQFCDRIYQVENGNVRCAKEK